MADVTPLWLAGQPALGEESIAVQSPYHGGIVGHAAIPSRDQVGQAVQVAADIFPAAQQLSAHQRAEALSAVSRQLYDRAEECAQLITAESGKPIKWSRIEVSRAVSTFRFAAEEARRFSGELQRLDTDPAGQGRLAINRRFARGPVLGISPFNFPLNLVAHKVAPAIAVGAPIIVKPAPKTPLTALFLGDLLANTDLPAGMFSILPVPNDRAAELVADPRLPVVSFTGSAPVGWKIKESVPRKHVVLELGGNAAAIVCPDYQDLQHAAKRIATYSNYQAGQSCIAVQRVFIADPTRYQQFVDHVVDEVNQLQQGDPADERTDVGPMINADAASRVDSWVNDAVSAGATIVAGGERQGTSYQPTVLTNVPEKSAVMAEEVFGPVLAIAQCSSVAEAFAQANSSRYGLQAGVFTSDIATAFQAHRELQVGGVIIGDVPSYRADQMPYGGIKDSGVGREGVRSTMDDLTEDRVMVLTGVNL